MHLLLLLTGTLQLKHKKKKKQEKGDGRICFYSRNGNKQFAFLAAADWNTPSSHNLSQPAAFWSLRETFGLLLLLNC
jgi:hypothetical protein